MAFRRILPVVETVDLPAGLAGPEPMSFDVRSFVLVHDGGVILVDTGLQPDAQPVARVLRDSGAAWDDVTDVVLTHPHPDHCGAVETITALSPTAALWGGQGDRFSVPVRPADDGTMIRGLRVVATPGHTPGHLSVFDETSGVLLTGDAVASTGGQLTLGPEAFIADRAEAVRSLRRLAGLGATRVVFSHGPEVEGPADALDQLILVCASSG